MWLPIHLSNLILRITVTFTSPSNTPSSPYHDPTPTYPNPLPYPVIVVMTIPDFLQTDRIEWLQRWQGQVIICINQTRWCFDVESTLKSGPTDATYNERALETYYEKLCTELMRTVELVRGDISKALRVAIGALVVMDVHNRDTVQEMTILKVTNRTDFDWLSQLRYYWSPEGESAQSGLPKTVECKMINAMALYAYEYIGNQDRLVITPLTDRCYRTLMGAIHLNLGGAPEGPAGTSIPSNPPQAHTHTSPPTN